MSHFDEKNSKPTYETVKVMNRADRKNLRGKGKEHYYSTGPGRKSDNPRGPGTGMDGITWIIFFSILAVFLSPLMYLIGISCGMRGHFKKVLSTNLAMLTLTIYFVVFTTSALKPAENFRQLGKKAIDSTGVQSAQLSLIALASAWVSVCVVHSYQLLTRSIVTWKLFGKGVEISHIASVVDPVAEKKFFSWSTIVTWIPGLVGAGSNVVAARCFKVWIPQNMQGAATVPAGGMDMYLLIALLCVAFLVEILSVTIVAMPVTARHLMEWSNAATRTGACGTHAGWTHRVRLVAVYGEKYTHLEFQDKFGSLEIAENQTWKDLSAFQANDEADEFYGIGARGNPC